MKPIVDGIEAQFKGQLLVIRLDIQSNAGHLVSFFTFGFQYTPTFIFFDARGIELWRTIGQVEPARVGESLK